MTEEPKNIQTPAGAFSERLKQVRDKRGWSQAKLAQRLVELGYPMSRETLAKIETGGTRAENVTLNDVLAISFALGVPPVEMMATYGQESRIRVVKGTPAATTEVVRGWISGAWPLADEDPFVYYGELSPERLRLAQEEARDVKLGEPTSHAAFFLRQAMISKGETPPITKPKDGTKR